MNIRPKIKLSKGILQEQEVVFMEFAYDVSLVKKVKAIEGTRWSKSLKTWYISVEQFYIENFPEELRLMLDETDLIERSDFAEKKQTADDKDFIIVGHQKADKLLHIKVHYKWKDHIKKLEGSRWDIKNQIWVCYDSENNMAYLEQLEESTAVIIKYQEADQRSIKKKRSNPLANLGSTTIAHDESLEQFLIWMRQRRFEKSTIKTYHHCLKIFFRYYHLKGIDEINRGDLEKFNHDFILANHYSPSTQNQFISAIKTYYNKMRGINFDIYSIDRPMKSRRLPKVIAKEDIQLMLQKVSNMKHKVALSALYSLGLRRGELISLKLIDINFKRDSVQIINSKGRKDRDLPLPKSLKKLIDKYLQQYNPQKYLI